MVTWSQHVTSWRREVHKLYADVRAELDPAAGHAWRVRRRVELFECHPASARQPGQHLRHAPYDPAYRFLVKPKPTELEVCVEPRASGSPAHVPVVENGRPKRVTKCSV